jgi:hypothetical protein
MQCLKITKRTQDSDQERNGCELELLQERHKCELELFREQEQGLLRMKIIWKNGAR